MAKKVHAVLIHAEAAKLLSFTERVFLNKDEIGCYFYAKKIDPNGNYFHMWLESDFPDGTQEFELQIPHSYVVAVFYSADLKTLGFTSTI